MVETELAKNMKSIKMLQMLSNTVCQKNYELYLKHELMLEQNRKERQELANKFQEQMQDLTEEININRAERAAETEDNNKIRKMIAEKID